MLTTMGPAEKTLFEAILSEDEDLSLPCEDYQGDLEHFSAKLYGGIGNIHKAGPILSRLLWTLLWPDEKSSQIPSKGNKIEDLT